MLPKLLDSGQRNLSGTQDTHTVPCRRSAGHGVAVVPQHNSELTTTDTPATGRFCEPVKGNRHLLLWTEETINGLVWFCSMVINSKL